MITKFKAWRSAKREPVVETIHLNQNQYDVATILANYGSLTDEQIREIHMSHGPNFSYQSDSGLRTRRAELVMMGAVRNSGLTTTTRKGGTAIVWELVAKPALAA